MPVVEVEGEGEQESEVVATADVVTEEMLFGEALPHVERLRKGVSTGALKPTQCAAALLQAVDHFGTAHAEGHELPPIF